MRHGPEGAADVRRLLTALDDEELRPRQRRRAKALLLYAEGLSAVAIARALEVHVNTVYANVHAFDRDGIACLRQRLRGGAPRRLTDEQIRTILALAERGERHELSPNRPPSRCDRPPQDGWE